ncbi:hypothetical protein LCGC14_1954900 [marine sediment metagenome]|uniref:Glycosyltransferase 2-like domain-containing protein n=1 Tax=marine sediment metagenome TaxID=412755 RepID=A0A0F9G4Q4_9ZZZZ
MRTRYSLNKGIEKTNGEFCVFVSAHCYPQNGEWLENLIKPFEDSSIALVYGRQKGDQETKYSEQQIFAKWFSGDDEGIQNFPFCNNANASIRKNLWYKYKFNETLTGLEDIDWAKYAISKYYLLYYATNAVVIHVHDETYPQIYRRYKMKVKQHLTVDDCLKLYEEKGIVGLVEKVKEISFKAGREQGRLDTWDTAITAAIEGTRREVVEWMIEPCHEHSSGGVMAKRECPVCLQAKIKEWRIKE